MIKKKIAAMLGCLLLAAAMPFAMAHTSSSDPDVAGNYYGPSGAYTVVDGTELFVASMLCDMEVLGDGTAHSPIDEGDVEGHPTGGVVPDGTFDDGGQGGACHTANQYAHGDYNSPGCGTDGNGVYLGDAFAEDVVSSDVWIGTACDWKSTTGGDSLTSCVVNELISGADPAAIALCVANFVNGNTGGVFDACGADGSADAGNFGLGSVGVPFPDSQLIVDDGCSESDASGAVFVYEDGNPDHVAVTGHIWQGTGSGPPPTGPRTATWRSAATVVVEGFPASADEGFVVCGTGVGGFCMPSSVAAVYVEDVVQGPNIAFQVCRDNDNDRVCTNDETRFSHGNDGTYQNPVAPPAGNGRVVVFICAGAHNLPTAQGPHAHAVTVGFGEERSAGGGFDAPAGFCGGGATGGKRYI